MNKAELSKDQDTVVMVSDRSPSKKWFALSPNVYPPTSRLSMDHQSGGKTQFMRARKEIDANSLPRVKSCNTQPGPFGPAGIGIGESYECKCRERKGGTPCLIERPSTLQKPSPRSPQPSHRLSGRSKRGTITSRGDSEDEYNLSMSQGEMYNRG
jgi:hypothetical protein